MVTRHAIATVALSVSALLLSGCPESSSSRTGTAAALVTGFNKARGFGGDVYGVHLAQDGSGDVYVGGGFTAYNSTGVNALVRLNVDGAIDTDFNVGTGMDGSVYTVMPATDGSGDVYVGGNFISYNGTGVDRLVRLNADGTIDNGFAVGTGMDDTVLTVTPAADGSGDVYVGGDFSNYDVTGQVIVLLQTYRSYPYIITRPCNS